MNVSPHSTPSPPTIAGVIVWDSQVKDGYKRSKAPAAEAVEGGPGDVPRPATMVWDGKRSGGVVEELLKNSLDKAYGTQGEI